MTEGQQEQEERRDDLDELLEEECRDPAFRAALADSEARGELVRLLLETRHGNGRTQADVAELMGTTQSAISELEGGATDPRLSTLQRYARAVGRALRIDVVNEAAGGLHRVEAAGGVGPVDAAGGVHPAGVYVAGAAGASQFGYVREAVANYVAAIDAFDWHSHIQHAGELGSIAYGVVTGAAPYDPIGAELAAEEEWDNAAADEDEWEYEDADDHRHIKLAS
jgi:transcriptional regulator with XRE-family HTH domain